MRIKLIQIRVTEEEAQMIEDIRRFYGNVPKADAIRRCIQTVFRKAFPVYIQKVSEPPTEATREQYCEMLGGKVIQREGKIVCVFQKEEGFGISTAPIEIMGTGDYKIKDKNIIIKIK